MGVLGKHRASVVASVIGFVLGVAAAVFIKSREPEAPPSRWVRYHDHRLGISISYPRSWNLLAYRQDCAGEHAVLDSVGVAVSRSELTLVRSEEWPCNPWLLGLTGRGWVRVRFERREGTSPPANPPRDSVFPLSLSDLAEAILRDEPHESFSSALTIRGDDRYRVSLSWSKTATAEDVAIAQRILSSIAPDPPPPTPNDS